MPGRQVRHPFEPKPFLRAATLVFVLFCFTSRTAAFFCLLGTRVVTRSNLTDATPLVWSKVIIAAELAGVRYSPANLAAETDSAL